MARVREENGGFTVFNPKDGTLFKVVRQGTNRLIFPATVHLLITYRCNLGCPTCEQRKNIRNEREMTTEELKSFIRSIKDAFMLAVGGGEPFLREDLFELIDYASNLGLAVSVTTNGTIVHRFIDEISKSQIKQIQFSLDGHTPEIHNLTHKSDFSTVVKNIKLVKKKVPALRVGINHIVHSGNIAYLDDFLSFCGRLGVNDVRLLSPKPPLPPLKENEIDKVREVVKNKKILVGVDDCLATLLGIGCCVAGREICVVDPYGYVLGCSHLPIRYGNVLKTDIKIIWEKEFNEFRGGEKTPCLLV